MTQPTTPKIKPDNLLVPVCMGLAGWRLPKRSRHSGIGAGVNIQVPCRPSLVDIVTEIRDQLRYTSLNSEKSRAAHF